jgi:hypothetical protein
MITVTNDGPDATPNFRRALRITGADLKGLEGLRLPAVQLGIRSQGRVLAAYVEVKRLTPAAVANVNRVLASVRACHA